MFANGGKSPFSPQIYLELELFVERNELLVPASLECMVGLLKEGC